MGRFFLYSLCKIAWINKLIMSFVLQVRRKKHALSFIVSDKDMLYHLGDDLSRSRFTSDSVTIMQLDQAWKIHSRHFFHETTCGEKSDRAQDFP